MIEQIKCALLTRSRYVKEQLCGKIAKLKKIPKKQFSIMQVCFVYISDLKSVLLAGLDQIIRGPMTNDDHPVQAHPIPHTQLYDAQQGWAILSKNLLIADESTFLQRIGKLSLSKKQNWELSKSYRYRKCDFI